MARSDRVVLDASVVIKWYVEEEGTDQALELLNDYSDGKLDIISVQLMPFEVMNALRYDPALGAKDLITIGQSLSMLQIALFPILDGLYRESVRIATEHGTTVYDASYLSLARSTGCVLYTSDAKFSDKVGNDEHLSLLMG